MHPRRFTIGVLSLTLLVGERLLAQDAIVHECMSLARPTVTRSLELNALDRAAASEVPRWEPHLSVIRVQSLESGVLEPDPRADSLEQELRAYAERDPTGYRQMLLAALRANGYRGVPELVANQAAFWYRKSDGRPGPVLAAIQGAPSDTWLLPLSAVNKQLTPLEEDIVAGVACDVALPLLAARSANVLPKGFDARIRLEWVDRSERILRHAERLVRGTHRPLVAALVGALQPSAARLDPTQFGGPS